MQGMLEQVTKGCQIVAIVCNQWGDTGKGKFSDVFAEYWADVIVRGLGGPNAGHTKVVKGVKKAFHQLPSSVEQEDKIHILGNGMVLDLEGLCKELDQLDEDGINYPGLIISEDANVIMPYHKERDGKKNVSMKDGGIGSTGKGIGPCYADKIARIGIQVRDLFDANGRFDPHRAVNKIKKAAEFYPDCNMNVDEIISYLKPFAKRIQPHVKDTITLIHEYLRQGKKILIEGAQGLLLSIEFGSYPYVTSSDCSLGGTASGAGLSANAIDLALGVVKFPYMTRVGAGPFPTEFGGNESDKYCAAGLEHDIEFELKKYGIGFTKEGKNYKYDMHHENIIRLINSKDPFEQGIGVRLAGYEYGTTTGRPRRTGWTDLTALKYAIGINGKMINGKLQMPLILTKADVLQGSEKIKLAVGYGNTENFTRDLDVLGSAQPDYVEFEGFDDDISGIRDYDKLPQGLKEAINELESVGGIPMFVSVGPDREETILRV